MPKYVDGFVIAIPKKNVPAYLKIAKAASKIWMEYGALEYREAVGEDLKTQCGLPFGKLIKLKPNETAIFAWIVYKSRAHRDKVNAKVMKDPRLESMCDPNNLPFDAKRMSYGGFTIEVSS